MVEVRLRVRSRRSGEQVLKGFSRESKGSGLLTRMRLFRKLSRSRVHTRNRLGKGWALQPSCENLDMHLTKGHSRAPARPSTQSHTWSSASSTSLAASSWNYRFNKVYSTRLQSSVHVESDPYRIILLDQVILILQWLRSPACDGRMRKKGSLWLSKKCARSIGLTTIRHHNITSTQYTTRLGDSGRNMVEWYVLLS